MNTNNNTNLNDAVNQSAVAHAALSEAVENRVANQLNAVKREVFEEYQGTLGANDHLLRLALHEAEALANQTEYPHLLFPLLAEEKAYNAARWQLHQRYLLRSNSGYALAA